VGDIETGVDGGLDGWLESAEYYKVYIIPEKSCPIQILYLGLRV
jgi:hypothetical protein